MDTLADLLTPDLIRSGIRLATPIILSALGGALCHRAGVLNLALEGKMLMGAFIGILAAFYLGNTYAGVLVAALAGGLLGAIFAYLYLRFEVNLIILAIAINLFIAEMTVFFMRTFLGDVGTWSDPSIEQLPDIPLPLLDQIPVLGRILSGHNAIVYFSWLASIGLFVILFYTKFGRHVRAVGENQEAAETVGINVTQVQVFALVISGMLCAIGGAFLSVGHLTLFTRNLTNGRGWIGLTAALFAQDHPLAVFLTGSFFGLADAFAIRLQTTTNVPPNLVQFIPHVLTLVALILVALRVKLRERLARRAFRLRERRRPAAVQPAGLSPR
ncbi:MAG TPA: ABC transporter permease [Anaerolineales bacterium]